MKKIDGKKLAACDTDGFAPLEEEMVTPTTMDRIVHMVRGGALPLVLAGSMVASSGCILDRSGRLDPDLIGEGGAGGEGGMAPCEPEVSVQESMRVGLPVSIEQAGSGTVLCMSIEDLSENCEAVPAVNAFTFELNGTLNPADVDAVHLHMVETDELTGAVIATDNALAVDENGVGRAEFLNVSGAEAGTELCLVVDLESSAEIGTSFGFCLEDFSSDDMVTTNTDHLPICSGTFMTEMASGF